MSKHHKSEVDEHYGFIVCRDEDCGIEDVHPAHVAAPRPGRPKRGRERSHEERERLKRERLAMLHASQSGSYDSTCPVCDGKGWKTNYCVSCPVCLGEGKVNLNRRLWLESKGGL